MENTDTTTNRITTTCTTTTTIRYNTKPVKVSIFKRLKNYIYQLFIKSEYYE